jgi:hypothetical protein
MLSAGFLAILSAGFPLTFTVGAQRSVDECLVVDIDLGSSHPGARQMNRKPIARDVVETINSSPPIGSLAINERPNASTAIPHGIHDLGVAPNRIASTRLG